MALVSSNVKRVIDKTRYVNRCADRQGTVETVRIVVSGGGLFGHYGRCHESVEGML